MAKRPPLNRLMEEFRRQVGGLRYIDPGSRDPSQLARYGSGIQWVHLVDFVNRACLGRPSRPGDEKNTYGMGAIINAAISAGMTKPRNLEVIR